VITLTLTITLVVDKAARIDLTNRSKKAQGFVHKFKPCVLY